MVQRISPSSCALPETPSFSLSPQPNRWVTLRPDGIRRALRLVSTAELESMFVVDDARDAAVGTGLVHAFTSWATARNAGRMVVTAYAENHSAVRFYRRLGFAPRKITLDSECVVGE
jgi:GNAT superfamily N-acetyltransferase